MRTPCVRQCTLDRENLCQGCFRTLDEIIAWHDADEMQRQKILAEARERRTARQQQRIALRFQIG